MFFTDLTVTVPVFQIWS